MRMNPARTSPKTPVYKRTNVAAAMAHLEVADPRIYAAALPHHREIQKSLTHRRNYDALFPALAGSIVSQQLSTKAADTIWGRLEKACKGSVTPEALLRLRVNTMRKAGLSGSKSKTLKELSRAIVKGELVLEALASLEEEHAIVELSRVWGIGRWMIHHL